MHRHQTQLLIVALPVLLMLFVLVASDVAEWTKAEPLIVLVEIATFGAVFAILPAAISGVGLLFRSGVPRNYRLGAAALLSGYILFWLYAAYGN